VCHPPPPRVPSGPAASLAGDVEDKEAAKVAGALSHPLRIAYLKALREQGKLSPVEFSRESDEPLGNVSYHVKVLFKAGFVEVGEAVQRRGAMEHRYALKEPHAGLLFELMDILAKA
jgi:DNA-binding transcriptional ArsR family regulator